MEVSFKLCPKLSKHKIIHFVRHAEGEHNAAAAINHDAYLEEQFEDSLISPKGFTQCHALATDKNLVASVLSAQLLLTSPMRRTMQTATLSFPYLMGKIPWIALESIRETTGIHPCDRRHPLSSHASNFPHISFDHVESECDPLYHLYDTREPNEDVIKRAKEFLNWLKNREESEIIVVTHSAFLGVFYSHLIGATNDDAKRFQNCEVRTCVIHFDLDR